MAAERAGLAPLEYAPGDMVAGRYSLKRKLGAGTHGDVWLARSIPLRVDVALKILRGELASASAVERLTREARTTAQLGHPALVRMLDLGSSERGEAFLAMELLEGEDLAARLARERRIAPTEAIALILPIIDGLGTAHESGVVHRDVKPDKIFIARDSQGRVQPKILDFGMTQAGSVVASRCYLSPEQVQQGEVDRRSDIWSVGVVIYELLTGALPFRAQDLTQLVHAISSISPQAITDFGVGDTQLWKIIERCLQKDPEQRWASMWEVGEALALWLFEQGVQVDAAARSLRHGWLESGLSGLQLVVPSLSPPRPLAAAGLREVQTVPPGTSIKTRSLAAVGIVMSLAGVGLALHRHAGQSAGGRAPITSAAAVAVATSPVALPRSTPTSGSAAPSEAAPSSPAPSASLPTARRPKKPNIQPLPKPLTRSTSREFGF